MNTLTLCERIFVRLLDLQNIESAKQYPIWTEEDDCEGYFQCHFCGEVGLFHSGNGGICHSTECAILLIRRLPRNPENLNFFDQLAYKSLLHQIAHLERYPHKQHPHSVDWIDFCPFCQRFMQVTKQKHQDGRGITFTYTMPHAKDCIVTLANAKLEQQGGKA